jgi:peptide/nickel transport system substrate-binding protein
VKAEDRAKLYAEAQRILVEEVANGYLVELEFPTLWRSNVKNLVQTAIGLNESFEDVWIAK